MHPKTWQNTRSIKPTCHRWYNLGLNLNTSELFLFSLVLKKNKETEPDPSPNSILGRKKQWKTSNFDDDNYWLTIIWTHLPKKKIIYSKNKAKPQFIKHPGQRKYETQKREKKVTFIRTMLLRFLLLPFLFPITSMLLASSFICSFTITKK